MMQTSEASYGSGVRCMCVGVCVSGSRAKIAGPWVGLRAGCL